MSYQAETGLTETLKCPVIILWNWVQVFSSEPGFTVHKMQPCSFQHDCTAVPAKAFIFTMRVCNQDRTEFYAQEMCALNFKLFTSIVILRRNSQFYVLIKLMVTLEQQELLWNVRTQIQIFSIICSFE